MAPIYPSWNKTIPVGRPCGLAFPAVGSRLHGSAKRFNGQRPTRFVWASGGLPPDDCHIPFDETTAFNNCYSICGMKEVTVSLKLETENLQKMYETVRKLLNSTSGGDLGSHDAFACKDACEELVEDYEHRRRRKANFETSLSSDEDDDIDASMENQKKAAFQAAKDEFLEIEEDNRIEEEEDEAEEPSSELDPVFTRFLLEHVAIGLKVVIETYRTLRMYRDSENEGGFIEKLSADVSQLHFLIAQYTYECSFKLSTEDFIGLYCSEKDLQILMTLSQNAMLHAIYDIAAQMNQNWKEAVIVMFSFLSLAPDESTLKWLTEKLRVFISWTAPVDSESFNRLIVELLLLKSSEGYSTVILRDIAQCLLLVDDRTILFKVLSGLDLYIIGNVLEEDNETVEFLFTSFTAAMENSAATDQSPTAENSLKTISEHKWTHVTVDEVEYETVSAVRSPLSLSHSIDLSSSSDLHFNIVLSLVKFCQLDLIENQLLLRFEKMSLELYEFVLYESSGDDEQRFAEEAERRDFLKKQEAFTNLLMAYLHRQTGEKAFMKILEIIPAATNEKPLIPVFLYTVEQNLFVIIKSPVVIGALSHRVSGSLELVQRFIGYYRTGRKFEDFAEYVGLAIDLFKLTLHLSLSTFLSERFTNQGQRDTPNYSEVLSFVLQKTARENHLKAILEIYTASPNHCKATILKHWISLQNQTFKKPVCESFRSNCSVVIRHPAANSNPCERKRGSTVNYQGNSPFVYDSGTGITFTFSLRLYHDGMKSAATIKLGRFSIKIVFTDVSVCRLMIHYKSKCISECVFILFHRFGI
ncbi:unnamed protein product [Caenorhabditis auriculariae]|uniref:Uncharacterized protein n=1 Tax=Caenorhabditis auriculariae TaxID=2777116 RepID=A0A8S1GVY2_9PELO|nr:unnamed protein product [Caenorhabditis auriculariae]